MGTGAPTLLPTPQIIFAWRCFRKLLARPHWRSLIREEGEPHSMGLPVQCTIGRHRLPRHLWRGRCVGSDVVIILVSRRTGSRSNVREANGRHRNCRCRCSSRTGSGALVNDGSAIRFGSGMMPIVINPAINRHFFRKARVFRVIINFSRPAMRLRQSGGTQAHPCGDCQRQNAIRHALCSRPPKGITVSYNYVGVLAGTTDLGAGQLLDPSREL